MEFTATSIPGVWIIRAITHGDSRGYFREVFKKEEFESIVGKVDFVQSNESQSTYGVLRGLHFQKGEFSQAKLVRVSRGRVLDVAVDLRKGSVTRGKYVAVELSQENACQLFVPKGFAHGFVVLSDEAQFQYMVDAPYAPQAEATLRYDDPDIAVEWPLPAEVLKFSEKDLRGISFHEIPENIFD